MQPRELTDMTDRQQAQQGLDMGDQTSCQAAARRQLGHVLRAHATGQAHHASQRHLQPHLPIKQMTLAHSPGATLVDQPAGRLATTTARVNVRIRFQPEEQLRLRQSLGLEQTKPYPKMGSINSIVHEGGGG